MDSWMFFFYYANNEENGKDGKRPNVLVASGALWMVREKWNEWMDLNFIKNLNLKPNQAVLISASGSQDLQSLVEKWNAG